MQNQCRRPFQELQARAWQGGGLLGPWGSLCTHGQPPVPRLPGQSVALSLSYLQLLYTLTLLLVLLLLGQEAELAAPSVASVP